MDTQIQSRKDYFDRKFTSKFVFTLSKWSISYNSKKKLVEPLSSTKAEYSFLFRNKRNYMCLVFFFYQLFRFFFICSIDSNITTFQLLNGADVCVADVYGLQIVVDIFQNIFGKLDTESCDIILIIKFNDNLISFIIRCGDGVSRWWDSGNSFPCSSSRCNVCICLFGSGSRILDDCNLFFDECFAMPRRVSGFPDFV